MHILKSGRVLRILLFEGERYLLETILAKISEHYLVPLDQLDQQVKNQWMHLEGILSSGFESEREYWEQHWEGLRSEREELSLKWKEELVKLPHAETTEWSVKLSQAENLLKIFNDHRLLTACREDLSEEDTSMHFQDLKDPKKQRALLEVDFLAILMELILDEIS